MLITEITVNQLKDKLDSKEDIMLLDVRDPQEYEYCHLPATLIPLEDIPRKVKQIPRNKPVIVICHHGFRSSQAIHYLYQRHKFTNLYNLKGGIHAWAEEIDMRMPTY